MNLTLFFYSVKIYIQKFFVSGIITGIFHILNGAVQQRLHHFRSMFYFDLYNFRETMKVRNFIPKNKAERFQDSDVTQGCRTSALIVLVMLIRMGSNT